MMQCAVRTQEPLQKTLRQERDCVQFSTDQNYMRNLKPDLTFLLGISFKESRWSIQISTCCLKMHIKSHSLFMGGKYMLFSHTKNLHTVSTWQHHWQSSTTITHLSSCPTSACWESPRISGRLVMKSCCKHSGAMPISCMTLAVRSCRGRHY